MCDRKLHSLRHLALLVCAVVSAGLLGSSHAAGSTTLLFTYATNAAGFDTGLIIANATAVPSGGTPVIGACTLSFYGTSAVTPFTTPVIPAGTVYTNLVSTLAPGFNGYVIAVCAFPGASGSTFISDLGARSLAAGYDAEVLPRAEDLAIVADTRDIEDALFAKKLLASIYLPLAQGGQLERVDQLVQDTIARVAASGEGTNNAASLVANAHIAQAGGRFKDAYLNYAIAYCRAVSPVARLNLCN